VSNAISRWLSFATKAGVSDKVSKRIGKTHRLGLAK
jgi:hypothetical protein